MTAPLDRPALIEHLTRQEDVCLSLARDHEQDGYHDGAVNNPRRCRQQPTTEVVGFLPAQIVINRAEARAHRVLKYKIEQGQFDSAEESP